jgi:hypothetical protein
VQGDQRRRAGLDGMRSSVATHSPGEGDRLAFEIDVRALQFGDLYQPRAGEQERPH